MGNEWLEVARGRVWARVGVAIERKRDEDDSRRLHNVREEKPEFTGSHPSLPAGDRRNRMRGKRKKI